MEIISLKFASLAILSSLIFYLLNGKYRTIFLLIISAAFVASFSFTLLIYIFIYAAINYFLGILIPSSGYKIALFRTGIILNLLQIILLKYSSFAFEPLFQLAGTNLNVSRLSEIVIPIGISYFTLQGIGYLVNIKMGWEKPEKNFLHFLLYIVFFPKFLSGPIERSSHFLPQIKNKSGFNPANITDGLRLALFGFFKKAVIANQLGLIVTVASSDPDSYKASYLWISIFLQPLYLYFDFSGYTDIARGFAKTFGIDLLPNFNKPFLSENVTVFWRRFHMSLSLWFNDYVFKQFAFRYRKWGLYASYAGVFITFLLFGIWHGAGWNFMVLGLIQALAINYEFMARKWRTKIFSWLPDSMRSFSGRIITYSFFAFSLVFFFSPDLPSAFTWFSGLFDYNIGKNNIDFHLTTFLAISLAVLLLVLEYLEQDVRMVFDSIRNFWMKHLTIRLAAYYLMIFLIMTQIGKKIAFVYQTF